MKIGHIFDREMKKFDKLIQAFPWDDQRAYAEFLAQTYFYTRHSSRLLSLCSANCSLDKNQVQEGFISHLAKRENGESLCLLDLKFLGKNIAAYEEQFETRNLYAGPYHAIVHSNPVKHYGYILALQGVAGTQMDYVHKIVHQLYTKRGSGFIGSCAGSGLNSVEDALKQIKSFSTTDQIEVMKNFEYSCFLYTSFLRKIESLSKKQDVSMDALIM